MSNTVSLEHHAHPAVPALAGRLIWPRAVLLIGAASFSLWAVLILLLRLALQH